MGWIRTLGRFLIALAVTGFSIFFAFAIFMSLKGAAGGPEAWMWSWIPIGLVGFFLNRFPFELGEEIIAWIREPLR